MDYRILVYFVLFHSSINALPYREDTDERIDFADISEEDEQKILQDENKEQNSLDSETKIDEPKEQKTLENEKKVIVDRPTPAQYAVTEIIVDIPDDRVKGPIITGFSIPKPLNFASTPIPNKKNEEDKDKVDNKKDIDKEKENETEEKGKETEEKGTDKEEGTGKKNYISIFHIKAEYDNKDDKTNKDRIETSDIDFGNLPHVSGIKEYFNGIKKGIVNGFNSIVHNKKNNEENHENDAITGPFSFFNKITKKTSDFAHKIHSNLFGNQEDDFLQ